MLRQGPLANNTYDAPRLSTAADTPGTFGEAIRTFLRQSSPLILAVSFLAAFTYRLTLGDWGGWDLLTMGIILGFWPLQEWLIHVFILHFRPVQLGRWVLDPRNALKHRAHHRDPWRLDLIFIPLFTVIPSIPLHLVLWNTFMPTRALAFTGMSFFLLLSLHYEWVHYIAHIRWRPASAHYQGLVDSHRRHHFKSERHWYGVSMLSGDRLLGTAPPVDQVPTSTTVRDLGVS